MHKNKTDKDLTEAEEIKKRWQEYTELYKKDLNDSDIHYGMVPHLESDILECEVKWALRSITMNKASGDDGILAELFQILKDDTSKFGKLNSDHRTGKGQFSFQSQKKGNAKECSN